MVTEEGIIEKTSNNKAMVSMQQSSACASCSSKGGCRVSSDQQVMIEVVNDLHAKVGDRVEISMGSGSLLKVSFFVYFIPILALIAGALAGDSLARSLHIEASLGSILGAVIAMGITFYVLRRLDKAAKPEKGYQPCVTRILFSATSPVHDDSK